MIIQFNTGHNIPAKERMAVYFTDLLTEELKRFSHQITRLEVHLTDEVGNKNGLHDIKCLLEARMEGLKPTVVTNHAETPERALDGAIIKMKASLDKIIGRLSHK